MQGGGEGQPGVVRLAAEEIFREANLLQADSSSTSSGGSRP
tara:strand:+ start:328 stop:450 length:123 start_codon:yes stop_codon:yes gene_type:complete